VEERELRPVGVGARELGRELDRPVEVRPRLVETALELDREPEVVLRLRVSGIEREGRAVRLFGRPLLPLCRQREPAVAVSARPIRPQRERA
jgi:hypothetical protein